MPELGWRDDCRGFRSVRGTPDRRKFDGARWGRWVASYTTFERCSFKNVRARNVSWGGGVRQTEFIDCTFDRSRLPPVAFGMVRFERCSFRDVHLKRWICREVDFVDCVFSGDLREFTVAGSDNDGPNEIRGNDFRQALMLGGGFQAGVDLTLQQLPDDDRCIVIRDPKWTLKAAYLEVIKWNDKEVRILAESTLEVLYQDFKSGQEQLLLCPDESSPTAVDANARLRSVITTMALD